MPFPGRPSIAKRQRELARREKRQEKAEKRAMRKAERARRPAAADGEDPDIAGVVPGPQPLPEQFDGLVPDDEGEEEEEEEI